MFSTQIPVVRQAKGVWSSRWESDLSKQGLTSCFFLLGNGIRFLGCINAFALIRSLIRSLVYSAPKELALPRIKCSRSSGRKEIYFKDWEYPKVCVNLQTDVR